MMLSNFRKIDKFYLSGGWTQVPKNLSFLSHYNIKAILDVQWHPADWESMQSSREFISQQASTYEMQYIPLAMRDDEFNVNLDSALETGHEILKGWETQFPSKRDNILIKCAAGISRSPTMLIYHLCIERRMSYIEALTYIRAQESKNFTEFGSSPNPYFSQYLRNKFK